MQYLLSLLQPKPPTSILYSETRMELFTAPSRDTRAGYNLRRDYTTQSPSQHSPTRHALALVPCNPNPLPKPPIM